MADAAAPDSGAATAGATPLVATPFSAVLFDCDGVLVDSEPTTQRVLAEMLRELGWQISEEETTRIFIGRALSDAWPEILAHTGVRITETWVELFHIRRDEALRESVTPIPGVPEMLAEIASRFGERIALASGADRVKIDMQLAVTGLGRWFDERVFSGMEQPRTKPAPDVYLAAARALGIDASTALVVEDTVAGVTAGIAAGATVFGFSPDSPVATPADTLRDAGATLVFTSMSELTGLIDGWGAQTTR